MLAQLERLNFLPFRANSRAQALKAQRYATSPHPYIHYDYLFKIAT